MKCDPSISVCDSSPLVVISFSGRLVTDTYSGPEVFLKTCVALKFVDDDDDDDDDDSVQHCFICDMISVRDLHIW